MYTSLLGCSMAKLYWRVKKKGKWTWKPANVRVSGKLNVSGKFAWVEIIQEEEEWLTHEPEHYPLGEEEE